MSPSSELLSCYNKGCGQKFDPNDNGDGEKFLEFSVKGFSRFSRFPFLDKCCFHPGAPIFHDAYKGWSCCNKKSTDFTEFLNFQGCSLGKHSNEKPTEPEKKVAEPEIEIPKPVERKPIDTLKRVPFETPCVKLDPIVSASFKQQMDRLDLTKKPNVVADDGSVAVGTSCKHGGCSCSYESPASDTSVCVFHPGVPVFHEGYKFWSCCQKKTSDFSAFLSQVGCESGKHKWIQEGEQTNVNCRWDWHQTAANVVVAVYAKNYDYQRSFVKVSPVRLVVKLIFPQQEDAEFNIDLELRGVIDAAKATANMYGTKVEVTLPKAEGGHWMKLDFPRETPTECETQEAVNENSEKKVEKPKEQAKQAEVEDENDSDVDLDDLELVQGARLMELGELARSCQLVEES